MEENKKTVLPSENVSMKAALVLLLLACIWGGNAVAMKIALRDVPPFMLSGLRFALGAVAIGLWGIFNKIDLKPRREDILYLIILSLIFAAQIGTFSLGANFTSAGRTSLFINTHPFFVAVLAHFFTHNDKLNIKKVVGLILAFFGILIIFRDKIGLNSSRVTGDILMLVSGVLLAVLAIYTKRLVQRINAYKLLLWEMILGLVPFFGLSFIFEGSSPHSVSLNLIIALLYQGIVVAGFGFVAWVLLLKRYSASKLSVFLFATPLFGVGLSSLMLQEAITPYLIIGAILVALGIYVVNKRQHGRV